MVPRDRDTENRRIQAIPAHSGKRWPATRRIQMTLRTAGNNATQTKHLCDALFRRGTHNVLTQSHFIVLSLYSAVSAGKGGTRVNIH